MSETPSEHPQFAVPYAEDKAPADMRNGMAIAAFVVSLLGVVLCPLGPLALVLGIIALMRANADPLGRGRTRATVAVVLGGLELLASVTFLPMVLGDISHARQISRRAMCTSNLRGIGQAMKVYSNDFAGWYPIAPCVQPDEDNPTRTGVAFIGNMGKLNDVSNCEKAGTENDRVRREPKSLTEKEMTAAQMAQVHPSRSLFMLVLDGSATPKQFICPSSDDVEEPLRHIPDEVAASPGIHQYDFSGYSHLSYGYQLPFGGYARPSESLDPRMALLADKGPFFEASPPVGKIIPDRLVSGFQPGRPPLVPRLQGLGAAAVLKADNDVWQPLNSRNHKREGENVLFGDGHVDFVKKPIVGVNYDNIYTVQSDLTQLGSLLGNVPADYVGPLTNTDSVIVP